MWDHTDVVIHSADNRKVRLANLPKPTKTMEWTVDQNEQYCRKNHNACFLTVTNTRPYYVLSCKYIANCQGGNHPGLLWPSFRFSPWTVRERKSFYVGLLSSLRGPATSVQMFTVNFWLNLHFWYWPVLRTKQAFSSWLLAYRFLRLKEILNHILIYSNGSSCTHSNLGETLMA